MTSKPMIVGCILVLGWMATPTVAQIADCNFDGIDDACDIDCGAMGGPCDVPGCGLSADCNANGIPDDCDFLPFLTVNQFPAPGFQPCSLTSDGTFLYMGNCSGFRSIFVLDTDGALTSSFLVPGSVFGPGGLAFDGNHLFQADIDGPVVEFDTAGTTIFNSFSVPSRAGGMTFDGAYLYVADLDSSRIWVFTTDGTLLRDFNAPLRPAGLAFNGTNLVAISVFNSEIFEFTTDGELVTSFPGPRSPGIQGLGGITFVGANIFIAEVSDADPFNPPDLPGTIFQLTPNPDPSEDCNANGIPDECDITGGTSQDCDTNGIPDDCDVDPLDPDGNGQVSPDSQPDGVPDECQIEELLNQLIQDVIDLNLQQGIENSLDAKLGAVLQALEDMNENNDAAACGALQAFINAIEAQSGNQISEDDANALIAAALAIREALGCPQ